MVPRIRRLDQTYIIERCGGFAEEGRVTLPDDTSIPFFRSLGLTPGERPPGGGVPLYCHICGVVTPNGCDGDKHDTYYAQFEEA